jgi:branched-chain amino acid transport system permease protein
LTEGVTILVAIPFAVAAAAAGGLLLGLPTLRLRADYFAIVTIAAGEILRIAIQNEEGTTGGTQGLRGASGSWRDANNEILDFFSGLGIELDRRVPLLVIVWLTAIAIGLLLVYLSRTPWRRVLRAVRENEEAAAAAGKPVFRYKLQALAFGSAIAGLAGVLYTLFSTTLFPTNFEPIFTFVGFAILILGGIGSYFGVVVGSVVIGLIVSGTRFLDFPIDADKVAALRFVVIGLLIMAVMAFRPQGLFGKKEELHLDA